MKKLGCKTKNGEKKVSLKSQNQLEWRHKDSRGVNVTGGESK